jgi:WD40 repeat protein
LGLGESTQGLGLAREKVSGAIAIIDSGTGREITRVTVPEPVHYCSFSPDGKSLLASSWNARETLSANSGGARRANSRLLLLDVATSRTRLLSKGEAVGAVAVSPDNQIYAAVSASMGGPLTGTITLWNAADRVRLRVLPGGNYATQSLAFSPRSSVLAAGGYDQMIRLWDPRTGHLLQRLAGHSGPVQAVAFSRSGRRLASVSEDQTVRIWDTVTGRQVLILRDPDLIGRGLAFSADGRQLFASGRNGIIVWDASPTGRS